MKRLPVDDFLSAISGSPLLDVRSPQEFASGHIPASTSFPLFSDDERALIGTKYKHEGRNPAIKKGLEVVGSKMLKFIEEAEKLQSDTLALYCWRGGMRSESMAWLLERYGFQTVVLEGGYKAYRNHGLNFFNLHLSLRVITGYTGSKKTVLLQLLKERGEQVIDLEALAHHQGSSFGNKKSSYQPTTEQFQNLVYEEFRKLDHRKPIWIEDESMRIGQVNLMEGLYRQMNKSPHIFLGVKLSQRLDYLVEDYGNLGKEELIDATISISKKLGKGNASQAIKHIQTGELRKAAKIILTYYDTWYDKSLSQKRHLIEAYHKIDIDDLPLLATKLSTSNGHAV